MSAQPVDTVWATYSARWAALNEQHRAGELDETAAVRERDDAFEHARARALEAAQRLLDAGGHGLIRRVAQPPRRDRQGLLNRVAARRRGELELEPAWPVGRYGWGSRPEAGVYERPTGLTPSGNVVPLDSPSGTEAPHGHFVLAARLEADPAEFEGACSGTLYRGPRASWAAIAERMELLAAELP